MLAPSPFQALLLAISPVMTFLLLPLSRSRPWRSKRFLSNLSSRRCRITSNIASHLSNTVPSIKPVLGTVGIVIGSMSSRGSYEVSKYLSILDATAPGLGLSAFEDDLSGRGRRRGRKRSMSSSSDSVGEAGSFTRGDRGRDGPGSGCGERSRERTTGMSVIVSLAAS